MVKKQGSAALNEKMNENVNFKKILQGLGL